ncbi:hypothetical protein PENVUL_c045G06897 [Penicillium vulpinum]|uniref:Reverse transcriptase zinc-binding domain-containing protein n=1 Tax=Penicillium vulpinum TaxID=29845 RepID=A0A1V6RHB2_9EURO|nr:hypothetical protein PENVUL_c045G06897 [Penicillium vulpinum]
MFDIAAERTSHIGINAVLFRWGKVDSPDYPHCEGEDETLNHVLFLCMSYADLRTKIWGAQRAPRILHQALGPESAKETARLLLATGRLQYLLPPSPIPDDDETDTDH